MEGRGQLLTAGTGRRVTTPPTTRLLSRSGTRVRTTASVVPSLAVRVAGWSRTVRPSFNARSSVSAVGGTGPPSAGAQLDDSAEGRLDQIDIRETGGAGDGGVEARDVERFREHEDEFGDRIDDQLVVMQLVGERLIGPAALEMLGLQRVAHGAKRAGQQTDLVCARGFGDARHRGCVGRSDRRQQPIHRGGGARRG